MASALDEIVPLIQKFKTELDKLDTASRKIAEANRNAEVSEKIAEKILEETSGIAGAHVTLVHKLQEQQQTSLAQQRQLLQGQLAEIAGQTAATTNEQLASLRRAGQNAQATIEKLLAQQPVLLADLKTQHNKGIAAQQAEVQRAAQAWADLLHQQMQLEVEQLKKAIGLLQKNTQQQYKDLSAITNQLQIATGRITAFAEAMNAARFLSKLDGLETGQREARQLAEKTSHTTATGLERLERQAKSIQQQLASQHKTSIETLVSHFAALGSQQAESQARLLEAVATSSAEQQASSRQLRLFQVLTIIASVAGAILASIALVKH